LNTGSFPPRNMGSPVGLALAALVGGKGLYHGLFYNITSVSQHSITIQVILAGGTNSQLPVPPREKPKIA
jgi:hypothetical protein